MSSVDFVGATKIYPLIPKPALDNVTFKVKNGEFFVICGESGSGKSTIIRAIAGLETLTSGTILIDDKDVAGISPSKRNVATVFQNYALYPHMSVLDNIGFSLKIDGVDSQEIEKKVKEAASILDLSDILYKKPTDLLGEQRQRVSIARSIVRNPGVFLMDDPLINLDARFKEATKNQLKELHSKLGVTVIYTTQDSTDAKELGDRVINIKNGKIL